MADASDQPPKIPQWRWRIVLLVIVVFLALGCLYFVCRFTRDSPVTYTDIEDHFKYGSTGGGSESGISYLIWEVFPKIFSEYFSDKTYTPGEGYVLFCFVFETRKDLPIGALPRDTQGLESG